ncbi:MAG: hypothetical protein O3B84_01990 [Chloroflexi bacterium]|nr:hypothetical protein [Chloroflexota bacterium]
MLVSEIHPANGLFYWVLSFMVRVEALYFHPLCTRLAGTRIGQIGGADVFSCADGWAFRVRAVAAWEMLAERIPRADWQTTYRGVALDFTNKAKQGLWRAFEDFQLLEAIQQKRGRGDVYVVRSARVAYLSGLEGAAELFGGIPAPQWASSAHGCLDRMWEGGQYAAGVVRLTTRLVLAILARLLPARETLVRCSILYLSDNLNDLHESSGKRSYTWLIDGERIQESDVLLVLPDLRDQRLERLLDALPGTTIQAGRIRDLYRRVPATQLGPGLGAVVTRLASAAVAPFVAACRSMLGRYLLSSMEFDPIVRHVHPDCCLETDSSLSVENPALVYFQQLGIATVMCHFTALLVFYRRPGGAAVRDFVYAHPLASRIVCWNEHAEELVKGHPHEGADVFALGPLMPGRDDVLSEDRGELRSRTLPARKPASLTEKKWVSVFDVMPNPAPRPRHPGIRAYAEPYTEDYWIGFMQDMLRLLNDDPELVIVYKPKRVHVVGKLYPVSSWFPTRANEFSQLVEAFHRHERALVLDEDINPWIPVAVADLCISLPAGSPVCVAWHLGIPGIYHDPLGQLEPDDYEDIQSCLTRDYPALRSKVQEFLWSHDPPTAGDPLRSEPLRSYIGRRPGSNANEEFREFVTGLIQSRSVPSAASEVFVPEIHGI